MTKLHTIEWTKEYLGSSDDQVRKLISAGELIAVNIGSGKQRRCLRITDESLQAFIKRRTLESPRSRRKAKPTAQREWV